MFKKLSLWCLLLMLALVVVACDEVAEGIKKEIITEDFTDEDVAEWELSLDRVVEESDDLIIKVEQLEEGRYDVIHVYLKDEFHSLSIDDRQSLVDEWGGRIVGNTKSRLLGNDAKVYVYFKNFDGRDVVKTKSFDDGWVVEK